MQYVNLCRFNTSTVGTGALSIGGAVSGYLTPLLAGLTDGATVTYSIRENAQSEIGYGVYSAGLQTITRSSVLKSTNNDSAISLTGGAEVALCLAAEFANSLQNWLDNIVYNIGRLYVNDNPLELSFDSRVIAAASTLPASVNYIETRGFYTVGDSGHGLYKRSATLNSGGFQTLDGANWNLVPDETYSVYGKQFGIKADNVTNDTTAAQAFIDYLEAYSTLNDNGLALKGYWPAGRIKLTALTIERALHLFGAGSNATRLVQISGSNTPFITVQVSYDTTDYYAVGNPPPQVILQGMRITGQGWSTGFSSNHGLLFQNAATNPITTEVILRDIRVQDFPGHNIYGLAFTGWVEGYEVSSGYAGLDALHCNSCVDWNFVAPQFYLGRHGVTLSGCVNMHFSQINCWSNREQGVYLFANTGTNAIHTATFFQGSIDRNKFNGVFNDLRNGAKYGARFIGINWSHNGAQTDNTYSDIYFSSASTTGIGVIGGSFDFVTAQTGIAAHTAKHHVEFHASSTGKCYIDASTHFVGGTLSTNLLASIVSNYVGSLTVQGTPVSLDVGVFTNVASLTLPADVNLIRTTGRSAAGDGGACNLKRVGSAPSHAGYTTSNGGTVYWEICPEALGYNVIAFGADATGVATSTTSIQAAVNAAIAMTFSAFGGGNGSVYFPAGIYKTGTITSAERVSIRGAGMASTFISLLAGVTTSLLQIDISDDVSTSTDDMASTMISDMTLFGNRTDSVTAGDSHGVYCPDAAFNMATQYGASVYCNNVNISGFTGSGFHFGVNRNWFKLYGCTGRYNNTNGLASYAFDSQIVSCEFGVNSLYGVRLLAGGNLTFYGCNIFYNLVNVVINSFAGVPNSFTNCTIDSAEQHGVTISGTASEDSTMFNGCFFKGNSRGAANTYSDILAGGPESVSVVGCTFWYEGQAVKYLIETSGVNRVIWVGNTYATSGSVPYGTAVTNDESLFTISQAGGKIGGNTAVAYNTSTSRFVTGAAAGVTGPGGFQHGFQHFATSGTVHIGRFSADAFQPQIAFSKSRNATIGAHTIVQLGDTIGGLYAYGSNGTSYDLAAAITFEIGGTPGASNDMPGRIRFFTTPDGSSTVVERGRTTPEGNWLFNTTTFGTSAAKVIGIGAGTAPTTAPADIVQAWVEDVNGAAGKAGLHLMTESGTGKQIVAGVLVKTDTGDPAQVHEGLFCINTFDNNVKVYADAGWRTVASGW